MGPARAETARVGVESRGCQPTLRTGPFPIAGAGLSGGAEAWSAQGPVLRGTFILGPALGPS